MLEHRHGSYVRLGNGLGEDGGYLVAGLGGWVR